MNYTIAKPNTTGSILMLDIPLEDVIPFIDWTFFFMAWRLPGKFEGIETVHNCPACKMGWIKKFPDQDKDKAQEALKLFHDAQQMLSEIADNKILRVNASLSIYDAKSVEDDILVLKDTETVYLPMLRQQHPSLDGNCYSLADFISPQKDYLGAFVTTVIGAEEYAKSFDAKDDVYNSILIKTLSDRVAEAAAEWLHWKVRKEIWGYAPDEDLSIKEMLKTKYLGIRPAVGYPSLPDQSIIFKLRQLLAFERIGVSITENGAMYPNASVCGLYFAHPKSKYFMIGKIDETQFLDYSKRSEKSPEEAKKWLVSNL